MRTLKLWPPIPSTIFDSTLSITGKCPSSSAAGETSPPVGSVYSGSTDKHYSWDYARKTWHDAQVQCSARGATLIESRTVEEHEVFLVMASKNYDSQDIVSVNLCGYVHVTVIYTNEAKSVDEKSGCFYMSSPLVAVADI